MNGDANLPHRSSSPLKRRASSMDPETEHGTNGDDSNLASRSSAQQATRELPRAMSVDLPESEEVRPQQGIPPIAEQIKIIETLLNAFKETPVREGQKAYIVSRSWVTKALALRSEGRHVKEDGESEPLGPVDNSDITEQVIGLPDGTNFIRLKPGTGEESFEMFPKDAWDLVVDWYGLKEGQEAIVRTAINQVVDSASDTISDPDPDIVFELHPPVFRVHRLWSNVSPIPIEQGLKERNPPPPLLVRSRKYHGQTFVKDLKECAGIPRSQPIRIWTIPRKLPAGETSQAQTSILTPPGSPGQTPDPANPQDAWPSLLLDITAFAAVRDTKIQVPLKDRTADENFNGRSSLQIYELVTDQTLVLDEGIGRDWVSTFTCRARQPERSLASRNHSEASATGTVSGRNSPAPQGPMTRGRAGRKRSGRNIGAVGLHNLGNTCYMNSALQCVRSVEELTKYFLTDSYVDEVNKVNPLGYHGRVALAYATLLKDIYEEGRNAVSPRDFKATVGRCRSTFSGWGQQDSQEFLGFLLDALQEDLSRIKQKPYIEKPDSTDDMIDDPEAIREMAAKVWDITRKRDDSVIADLFTGMYKSTLKCPECGKISITFDPFNNLTLPLPVKDMFHTTAKFFPLNDAPVFIDVELPKNSSIESLKQFVSDRTGVPIERLMAAEEYKDRFFKVYDNNNDASEEISKNDLATVHELEAVPTNWPDKGYRKKYRSMLDIDTPPDDSDEDDPRYESMVVPVFHRRPDAIGRNTDGASPPHFIVLSKEETSNYDLIRRKVLEKVATFSTWTLLSDDKTVTNSDNGDSDIVLTTASDADSSGDGKVAARSVESEDDVVDVSMKDVTQPPTSEGTGDQGSKILKRFNRRRPQYVDHQGFLKPELQNLFELSYFSSSSEGTVPTGWNSVDNTRQLPKISDRIPESPVEDDNAPSPESWNSAGSGNEESSNEDASREDSLRTRMNEESTDEDVQSFSGRQSNGRLHARGMQGSRKKFKNHKTYGKKGNKRRDKQMRANKEASRLPSVKPQPMPPAVADGGPLIRLGEGLVVDWNEDAWNTVFGGHGITPDSFQGARTFVHPETLHDAALKSRQARRQTRRSRGITLEECLDEFERAEVLSEQDMWYCPRCKEHRRASKKFDLWKTPDILVAHLKRFSNSGLRRDKLDVLVDFPIEGLDLTSRVIEKEDGKDEVYDLIGVDDHYGGLGGGHYTAYAKNFMDGKWYNYNDSSVSQVHDPTTAINSAAYLLFYRRRSTKPLGGARFAKISEKFNNPDDEEGEGSEDDDVDAFAQAGARNSGGSMRTTVRALDGPDDEDPPPYEPGLGGTSIRASIEKDESEYPNSGNSSKHQSLDMKQGWNFTNIREPEPQTSSSSGDADSAAVQLDSDEDQQRDIEMDLNEPQGEAQKKDTPDIMTTDIENGAWERRTVLSVPAQVGSDHDSDEVAEIRLDNDKSN